MTKRRAELIVAMVMLVGLAGCDLNPQPTPNGPTPTPLTIKPISQGGVGVNNFATYKPVSVKVKPAVPNYSTDPSQAARQDVLGYYPLSNAASQLLAQNGFVVLSNQSSTNVYDVYEQADSQSIPVIVTTDGLLHTYHLLYDYTLRKIENDYLAADAKALTDAMLPASQQQYAATNGMTNAHEAARRNIAYFAVAARLFDDNASVPTEVSDVVNKELTLISAHAGFDNSPLFGSMLDYSQFVPRGHYTRSDLLKHYFMGMMWFGLTNFRVDAQANSDQLAVVRMETRQALLISALLADPNLKAGDSTALDKWQRIYEPTNFFVGQSDDLNVYDYTNLAAQTFGGSLSLADLDSDAKIDQFMQAAGKLPAPKINGGFLADNEGQTALKGWRFMGQRFIPDSYIFQQLVYSKVGTQNQPRNFPTGLDVTAAMGSDRAYAILKQMGENKYANYDAQMQKLQGEFASDDTSTWTQNLYWNWLYSLKSLTAPKGAGYPVFMQNAAWSDRQLYTYLGSWTELRHDTILYAKQSNTLEATGAIRQLATPTPPPPPRGYVEPQPEVYARLQALAQQSKDGLTARGLLDKDFSAQFDLIIKLSADLGRISAAELGNQPISDADYTLIREFGSTIDGVQSFALSQDDLSNSADRRMASVADVHTDPNSSKALEEGVGNALPIIVIAPVDGKPSLLVGAQYSQYEFTQPMDNRLTDEQWQKQLDSNSPPLANWTSSFIR